MFHKLISGSLSIGFNFLNFDNRSSSSFDLPTQSLKELLKKLVSSAPSKEEAMKKVKEYFDKFVAELKSLPYEIKKSLLKKFLYVFIAFIPIGNLITRYLVWFANP